MASIANTKFIQRILSVGYVRVWRWHESCAAHFVCVWLHFGLKISHFQLLLVYMINRFFLITLLIINC